MAVCWDVAPCILPETDERFKGAYYLHHQGDLMTEAVSISETSVSFYETTRRNIPADSHLHTRRRENLKSQFLGCI
jgi:hypothetical protein